MKMIKVTRNEDKMRVYINVDHIVHIRQHGTAQAHIIMTVGYLFAHDKADAVAKRINTIWRKS